MVKPEGAPADALVGKREEAPVEKYCRGTTGIRGTGKEMEKSG